MIPDFRTPEPELGPPDLASPNAEHDLLDFCRQQESTLHDAFLARLGVIGARASLVHLAVHNEDCQSARKYMDALMSEIADGLDYFKGERHGDV